MSWDFVKTTYPAARKVHKDEAGEVFSDFGVIKMNANYEWVACDGNLNDVEIEPADMEEILAAANSGFFILPGQKHICCKGKCEGEWLEWRASIRMQEFVRKYELYFED